MEERFIKISSVAYKILEYFPEQDPIKNKAKEKVLDIMEKLSLVLGTDGWVSLQKDKDSNQLIIDIDVFLSYLEIAKTQRWLDQMNYLIISKEYIELKKEILQKPNLRNSISIDSSQITNHKLQTNPEIQRSEVQNNKNDKELTERQKKIIEILKNNQEAQVSDIIRFLPNITKRTIRRDLDGLLSSGVVVRVGEWNKIFYQVSGNDNRTVQLS